MPSVRKKGASTTQPPRASADSGSSATAPSRDINEAATRFLDALTKLTEVLTAVAKEGEL